MNPTRRTNRIASLMRDELGSLLVFGVSDPRLMGVSVTDVEISRDLKEAKIFYVLGAACEPKEVIRALERARPFFRRHIGQALNLRQVPELTFELDTHTEEVCRLMSLLDEVKRQGTGDT